MDFLKDLNDAQRKAVEHIEGPSMVIAGAGSGKTRVLTYRIAYLMESGVDPFSILALTFTNKAAKEMKERIAQIVGPEARNISMGTFHSVFAHVLRMNASRLGYPSNFTIYDTSDSKSLIKAIIRELKLDDKIYKPGAVFGRISSAKNNLISPDAYAQNLELVNQDKQSRKPLLYQIYKTYAQRCFKAGAMDFDDLLFKMNELLRDFPDVLHHYQHKFQFILVDEYQDTNYAQYLIIKKLGAVHENICVVGDDAQSIYSFRGANIQNILNFQKDYSDTKTFKLEQNYRSTQNIVNAANSIIEKNKDQIKKDVWTDNTSGKAIKVIKTLTDNEEGKVVAQSIYEKQQEAKAQPSEFVILYRTNAQSRSFEEALRKLNIPYKIYGGTSFYQRKEIKDLLGYFRLISNPKDEEALKRIINFPRRGIGNTTMDHLILCANDNETTLWDVMENMSHFHPKINSNAAKKIHGFVSMINRFRSQLDKTDAFELADEITKLSGIYNELKSDKTPEGVNRWENVQELLTGIKEFSESQKNNGSDAYLTDFLIDVALLTDIDQEKEEDLNKVTLMTIHASKGLEFPYVFIVGLEENLFPSQMALNTRSELEEERRLFYVALTRAEKEAVLTFAGSRFRFGNAVSNEPSRFIDEIDTKYIERALGYSTRGKSLSQGSGFSDRRSASRNLQSRKLTSLKKTSDDQPKHEQVDLKVGYNVMHERFGKGKVVAIQGTPPDQKATVFFPRVGQKQLLLKFAKLEVVD